MKRRDFIKGLAPMSLLPFAINGQPIRAYGNILGAASEDFVDTDRVLVLIQMNGGNDGLNTVIPLDQYSQLSAARSNVLIPENKVLGLDGYSETGLHPAMSGMRNMFNDGKVNIVQNVGYPNQNYSHFRSTDIWLTGADWNETLESGWIGRYLSEEWPNYPNGFPNDKMPDPLAIQIGSIVSPVCQGMAVNMGFAISNPNYYYQLLTGDFGDPGNTWAAKELDYVRRIAHQANEYTEAVGAAADKADNISTLYPETSLARQLKIVAQLIAGGLKTRVYVCTIGGFDTHANQVDMTGGNETGAHASLLQNLSDSVNAFQDDITKLGVADRVLGMTFSEFGRRIVSNGSTGTDHGAAAPLFLFGNKVKSGIIGDNPQLPNVPTVNDNLEMETDFRSIYSTILQNWFCLDPQTTNSVILDNFDRLDILNSECQTSSIAKDLNKRAGDTYLINYPNPFSSYTTIRYYSEGGHVQMEIINTEGKRVALLVNDVMPVGEHQINFDAFDLAPGTYYCRYQNQSIHHTRSMIKI
ncbi:DUF1501 domain-containing protein [bacterium]|nr:DUF1501 domain-containing protein [bacterium]